MGWSKAPTATVRRLTVLLLLLVMATTAAAAGQSPVYYRPNRALTSSCSRRFPSLGPTRVDTATASTTTPGGLTKVCFGLGR